MKVEMVKTYFVIVVILVLQQFNCAPVEQVDKVTMVKSENEIAKDSYYFSYTLSDGQRRDETGTLKKIGDVEVIIVKGYYSFRSPDGKKYRIKYTADENGFRAEVPEIAPPTDRISKNAICTLVGGCG